jgi:hypothetical protein
MEIVAMNKDHSMREIMGYKASKRLDVNLLLSIADYNPKHFTHPNRSSSLLS